MRLAARSCAALVLLALAACDEEGTGPMQRKPDVFVWRGTAGPGATLTVRNFAGDIEVQPSADDSVRVNAALEWRGSETVPNDVRFSATTGATPGDVLICGVWGDGRCTPDDYTANVKGRRGLDAKAHFTIQVPAGMRIVAQDLSGDVTVAAAAPVRANTLTGDVRVVTAVGPVHGETLNGDVDIRMTSLGAGTDSIVGKTLNGDVFIYLRDLHDLDVDLGVMNGGVASTFPLTDAVVDKKSLKVRVGTGARALYGYTLNGRVELRQLDSAGRAP